MSFTTIDLSSYSKTVDANGNTVFVDSEGNRLELLGRFERSVSSSLMDAGEKGFWISGLMQVNGAQKMHYNGLYPGTVLAEIPAEEKNSQAPNREEYQVLRVLNTQVA